MEKVVHDLSPRAEAFVATDTHLALDRWLIDSSTPARKKVFLSYAVSNDGREHRCVSTLGRETDDARLLIAKETAKALPKERRQAASASLTRASGQPASAAPGQSGLPEGEITERHVRPLDLGFGEEFRERVHGLRGWNAVRHRYLRHRLLQGSGSGSNCV